MQEDYYFLLFRCTVPSIDRLRDGCQSVNSLVSQEEPSSFLHLHLCICQEETERNSRRLSRVELRRQSITMTDMMSLRVTSQQ